MKKIITASIAGAALALTAAPAANADVEYFEIPTAEEICDVEASLDYYYNGGGQQEVFNYYNFKIQQDPTEYGESYSYIYTYYNGCSAEISGQIM